LIKVLHNHNPKPFSYSFSSRYRLSSYFGIRNLQHRGASLKKHCGIDIAAPRGTPILALTDGVVKMQFNHKFGGKSVIIEANQSHQGKRVRYSACHMQNFNRDLREGSRVSKGKTIIGYVGSTGRSTGPHVHLTIYEYSKSENSWLKVNPLKYTQGCALPDNFNANRYQFENCSQISRAI
jgi:murein DD-endopeptidase